MVTLGVALGYAHLLTRYRRDWKATESFVPNPDYVPTTTVSVIVPARNEAERIERCMHSLARQNYPIELVDLIVVDDESKDDTAARVASLRLPQLRLLSLATSTATERGKKAALTFGIANSSGELIVTTDADVEVPPNWLKTLVEFRTTCAVEVVAAPVAFHQEGSRFQRFQSLDFTGMMGITAAGIRGSYLWLANGANFCYTRTAFRAVGGFSEINHVASGDDVLLIEKFAQQFPDHIAFLKSTAATVNTDPCSDWRTFLRQRLRWASKTSDYSTRSTQIQLGVTWLHTALIFSSLLLGLFASTSYLAVLGMQLVFKVVPDFRLLRSTTTFFRRADLMHDFWAAQVWHCAYIFLVGLLSIAQVRVQWKGRRV